MSQENLLSSLKGLISTGTSIAQTRLELISTDVQIARGRFISLLVMIVFALFFLFFGLVMLALPERPEPKVTLLPLRSKLAVLPLGRTIRLETSCVLPLDHGRAAFPAMVIAPVVLNPPAAKASVPLLSVVPPV